MWLGRGIMHGIAQRLMLHEPLLYIIGSDRFRRHSHAGPWLGYLEPVAVSHIVSAVCVGFPAKRSVCAAAPAAVHWSGGP